MERPYTVGNFATVTKFPSEKTSCDTSAVQGTVRAAFPTCFILGSLSSPTTNRSIVVM